MAIQPTEYYIKNALGEYEPVHFKTDAGLVKVEDTGGFFSKDNTEEILGEVGASLAENAKKIVDYSNIKMPRIITLIGGQDDEVFTKSAGDTSVAADTANYKVGDRGWKLTIGSAEFCGFYLDTRIGGTAIQMPPYSALGLWLYVTDVTKVSAVRVDIYSEATYFHSFTLAANTANISALVNGWNLIRWPITKAGDDADTFATFGVIYQVKTYITTTAATEVTIGHMWVECPPKAQVLFIHDGGYADFYSNGYPDLKARGIPCTWAIQPSQVGLTDKMTLAQVLEVGKENNNSVSMHSYGGGKATNDMTAAELRADCMQCIKWLERYGFDGRMWRAAWLQNLAPQSAACKNLFLGFAMSASGSPYLQVFPFINSYDIKRFGIHAYNANLTALDMLFTRLKNTNALFVCYTHKVTQDGDASNISKAAWTHFLDKCSQGMSEGWLEGVTFETLMARAGVKNRQGYGDWVTELYGETGTVKTMRLP